MRKMRTAEEMLAYYLENVDYKKKTGFFDLQELDKNELLYYEIVEAVLEPDEFVHTFFWGHIYIYMSAPVKTNWIFLFTNKKIIAVCADDDGIAAIDYSRLKNIIIIPIKKEVFFDIDSWYRGFSDVGIDQEDIEFIQRELKEVMPFIREIQEKEAQKKKFSGSPAEEIRRFKELCDDGIITKEEFEDRKRELLKFKYME